MFRTVFCVDRLLGFQKRHDFILFVQKFAYCGSLIKISLQGKSPVRVMFILLLYK